MLYVVIGELLPGVKPHEAWAKKEEWDKIKPTGFKEIGEYILVGKYTVVFIIEADTIEDIMLMLHHYKDLVTWEIHPAIDNLARMEKAKQEGSG